MAERRSLQDLTIKDNFMFGAVMLNSEICREVLELSLGIPIERVEVDYERSIVYHPEYRSVRLDAYAKDEYNTRYNVEMQVESGGSLIKRARYYHSQIDMEILEKGTDYETLSNNYVIFICDFDPIGEGKYRYTQKKICEEVPECSMEDGIYTIFLSTKGTNEEEVPPELVQFLKYVEKPMEEEVPLEDPFVKKLKKTVKKIKADREMGASYMLMGLMMRDERREGRKEHLLEQICKKIKKGKSVEEIADELEEETETIKKLMQDNNLL